MSTTNVSSRAPMSRAQLTGSGSEAPHLQRSEFKEGSIRSLKLKNFLVYKDVKVTFGSRLNMVVGPNGSGKSTLVCAIALGLAGSPKVLGRADNLSAFVMHGVKDDASVTVELHRSNGNHLFITRTFSKKSNQSIWHMDGRAQTEKQVKEKILALGIQVDNLCTMLPQDKVGDFSGFTPDKLLLETEKALSFDTLYKPHTRLIELQENKGKTQNEEETMGHKLEGMEAELSILQNDVQRHEEREEKEKKLDLHKKRLVWWKVERLSNMGLEARREEKEARTELRNAEAADSPLQDEFKVWEREGERLRVAEKNRSTAKTELEKAINEENIKIEGLAKKAIETNEEIKNLEKRRKTGETTLGSLKNALEHHREDAETLREKLDQLARPEDLTTEINAKLGLRQDAHMDLQEQEKITSDKRMDIREVDEQIKRLKDQAAVREQKFRTRFREEGALGLHVRDWAARNADKLRGPVVGPIALEVTVKDPEAASAVETHIPSHVWCSVVVTCKEDHDTLIKTVQDQRASLSILTNHGGGMGPSRSTFSKQEMAQLNQDAGVRGFLDNFIECPDTVRQVLRRNFKIDSVFLGSAKTQQTIAQDPNFLPRLGKKGPNGFPTGSVIYAGGSYGAPQGGGRNGRGEPLQMYHTKISLYGARKPSVRVSETRPAQVVGPGLDTEAVEAQESIKAQLEALLAAATEKRDNKAERYRILDEEWKELKGEHARVVNTKKQLNSAESRVRVTEKKVERLEQKLAVGGDSEKKKLKKRLEAILEQQATTVAKAQELLSDMLDASVAELAAQCARRIAGDKLEDAKDALMQAQESRKELEERVRELTTKKNQVKKQFAEEMLKAKQTAPQYIDGDVERRTEFGARYNELPSDRNELEAVVDDLTEDLRGSVHNPQIVKRYQKLKEETEKVRKQLSDLKEGNASAMKTMENVREPWKESLQLTVEKLNEKFKEYMSKMDGCGGEVRLAETESYKKWGIEIRVRFRAEKDQGKMAVLDKRVHSGGERSVSTILFLMALQDLQSSPFRVVDEINQGMDPRNERQVFSRIVDNSCGANRTNQYFLITPKLLQGLVAMDNKDMTVIFIMNGPNCVTGTDDHTMKNFIEAKRRLKRQRGLEGNSAGAGVGAQGSPPQRRRIV